MTLDLKTPSDIYQRVNDELARITQSLNTPSTDPALNLAQQDARELLREQQTQRYDLELNGQPFALLDVPGIEGNEGLVVSQIEKAVQTAHAVLYVTNQAAPPQTGDAQRKRTPAALPGVAC